MDKQYILELVTVVGFRNFWAGRGRVSLCPPR